MGNKQKKNTENKRKYLFEQCGGICPDCGRQMSLNNPRAYNSYMTIDHIVPLNLGGTNNIENLRGLCRECNKRKSDNTDGVYTKVSESGHYISKMNKN